MGNHRLTSPDFQSTTSLQNSLVPTPSQGAPTVETMQNTEYRRLVEDFQKIPQAGGRNHISNQQEDEGDATV